MRQFLKLFAIVLTVALAVSNANAATQTALKKVEPRFVCMINNKFMGHEQIPVKVEGRTYYGCCPMCKAKLEGSAKARTAVDPVSKKPVDKASAVIGAKADGSVLYFESEKNFKAYRE